MIQFNERSRWLSFEQPSADLFAQRGLYVSEIDKDQSQELARRFANVQRVCALVRLHGTEMIKQYVVYSIGEPIGSVLGAAGESASVSCYECHCFPGRGLRVAS